MNSIWKGIVGLVFILGFIIPLESVENTIKDSLFFGDKSSPIEIYVFTDWGCPACREVEPELKKIFNAVSDKAKMTFVDYVIHTETLNYSPYNVSFMVKNKPDYFQLRDQLTKLSAANNSPTEKEIEKIAESEGVKYQKLNDADIALSQKYFNQLAKQFGISHTPTVVIVNLETKKGKKLTGVAEITESNVLKAMDSLNDRKN